MARHGLDEVVGGRAGEPELAVAGLTGSRQQAGIFGTSRAAAL
jgi:hypothetical protein